MGIARQKRVHKSLEWYADRLDDIEGAVMGFCGVLAVMFMALGVVVVFIDHIRQRPFELDWLQTLGIVGCVAMTGVCLWVIKTVNDGKTGW